MYKFECDFVFGNVRRNTMYSIIMRVRRLLAIHGFTGCLKLSVKIFLSTWWSRAERRRLSAAQADTDSEFDRKWGVDTRGTLLPAKSAVVGPNWLYGARYQGIDHNALSQVLAELPIGHDNFTFVDFGSGKGRALLVASQFPFKKIIGVEYSAQLSDVARQNLSRFPKEETRCGGIELVCADAARCPIPEGPLVVMLNNPFGKTIMAQLVRNVAASFRKDPRRIIILYFVALFADAWRNAGFVREVRGSKWISIYDTQPLST